jgi:DMSO/TMAO reductase YedYZ molybdopterin-dependent catalytic subunit
VTEAGDDDIKGRGGNDTLFGDNTDFVPKRVLSKRCRRLGSKPWILRAVASARHESKPGGLESPGLDPREEFSHDELQLAARNHGIPLEALRHDVTPVGLHYLLIHYDIPSVDAETWRLEVGGEVEHDLSLSLADIRARPAVTLHVTMECAGNGRAQLSPRPISQPWLVEAVGSAEWKGTSLRGVLEEAKVGEKAVEVLFTGLDSGVEGGIEQSYERSLALADAMSDDVLLAYEINSQPLPPQHGYPLRLVVPGWYGMTNVKWLERITCLREPFRGYQQKNAYRLLEHDGDDGIPVTRMLPRSLLIPPGIPDFMTRERYLDAEPCAIRGRAWSGLDKIARVDVSVDGGSTWENAELGTQASQWAWCSWRYDWRRPKPGRYVLCSRATDEAGNRQPIDVRWNLKGYANNAVQRVPVTVRA